MQLWESPGSKSQNERVSIIYEVSLCKGGKLSDIRKFPEKILCHNITIHKYLRGGNPFRFIQTVSFVR